MEKDWKTLLEEEVDVLRRGRDELRVQIHLGAAEAHDAWNKIEKSWNNLESRLKRIGEVGQESAEEVEAAAKLLIDEIKDGYKHVRDIL